MKKTWMLCLLLCAALFAALPGLAEGARRGVSDPVFFRYTGKVDGDDLLLAYIDTLPGGARKRDSAGTGERLTGQDAAVYSALLPLVKDVADGRRASTAFALRFDDLGIKRSYTAADLGMDSIMEGGTLKQEAVDAVFAGIYPDLHSLINSLLADCPYAMYWFDKTKSTQIEGISYSYSDTDIVFDKDQTLTLKFPVAGEYATGAYTFDTGVADTIRQAVVRAAGIVSEYASASDFDKLDGYRRAICGLTGYNDYAADNDIPYGNPWQMIWVFDGDESTQVVCEGYAKAFQYLCDQTAFDEGVTCISVSGDMNGGAHMWNLVGMPDGKNYLADITNCDAGMVGAEDLLFLAGYHSGSAEEGYVFRCDHGSGLYSDVSYVYDPDTLSLFPVRQLTVASEKYRQGIVWGETQYTWAEDYSAVTALRTSISEPVQTETETASATGMVTKAATCEEMGETTYAAAFENTAFQAQTVTVANLPALEHSWGEAAYTWAEDNKTVTATRVCVRDEEHIETETADATKEDTKAANCTEKGETTYTAAFENEAFATQTKTEDIPALGHSWGEVTYTWAEDLSAVTAARVCARDEEHIETETADATKDVTKAADCEEKGETTYTAAFENEAFTTQTRTLADLPALDHNWGEVTYTWAEDLSAVTAARVCARNEEHTETETADTTKEVTKAADCTEKGETTYTAAFENEAFADQTQTEEIPALGHSWGEVTYTWAEDMSAVTATRVCARDGEHIETETQPVALTIHAPTEEIAGKAAYACGAFENEAFEAQTREVELPALAELDVLRLPEGLKTAEREAFTGLACQAVILPAGCEAVESRAFADCPRLIYVSVPAGAEVAEDAFAGCPQVFIVPQRQ